jgi:hypothetical protein
MNSSIGFRRYHQRSGRKNPHLDGTGLRFETIKHDPDTMPQAIKVTDAEGRSCICVPIRQDGRVVDSLAPSLTHDY